MVVGVLHSALNSVQWFFRSSVTGVAWSTVKSAGLDLLILDSESLAVR